MAFAASRDIILCLEVKRLFARIKDIVSVAGDCKKYV